MFDHLAVREIEPEQFRFRHTNGRRCPATLENDAKPFDKDTYGSSRREVLTAIAYRAETGTSFAYSYSLSRASIFFICSISCRCPCMISPQSFLSSESVIVARPHIRIAPA